MHVPLLIVVIAHQPRSTASSPLVMAGASVSCCLDGDAVYTGIIMSIKDGPIPSWRATVVFEDGTEVASCITNSYITVYQL